MSRYKATITGDDGAPSIFWETHLRGHNVIDIIGGKDGIDALILDNGEMLPLPSHAYCPKLTLRSAYENQDLTYEW